MKLLGLFAGLGCASALGDLERVRSKVPRAEYKGEEHGIGHVLNGHLEKAHQHTKSCNQFTAKELQKLQAELHAHLEENHEEIYASVKDTRALRFGDLAGYQAHWNEMNEHAATHHLVEEMQRDGHCLEIVMWWVHHLSQTKREALSHLVIPKMPTQRWREPTPEEGVAAAVVYGSSYNPSSTCLACHGGGLPWQNPDNEPVPFPRQVNHKDRQRRCDEYYSDENGYGKCNACEGIAGAYYGDMPDLGIYVDDCEILSGPDDVPKEKRANTRWPKKFAVEMRGADRWPRASASGNATCNFTTDCSPYNKDAEGVPLPPTVPFHWYASIHGVLYVDHNDGQFGGGRLRHESVYEFPSGEEGAKRALSGRYGDRNVHLTEIHVQTPEMAAAADPGVMLNLEHKNMTEYNASGGDDSKVDWRRIPSTDGDCVCVPDPAGLPYFERAYDNATYLGRVRFTPPWQETGTGGPPTGKPVVADHWVKWTFHMLVDIDTNLPVMFSSPFGGCATYGNWSTPADMWPEWSENPARDRCFDVTQAESCKPYVQPSLVTV